MINEFALPGPHCGEADLRPNFILGVHYLYFAIILATITVIITGAISLMSPPIERRFLYRLTWWTRFSTAKRGDIEEISKPELKKLQIFVKNPSFGKKSKSYLKVQFFVKNPTFSQKSKFQSKIQILLKNPNFG